MAVNLRSVDLNLLIVFEALMAEGQLSAAATRLGMTQSAASSALARLRSTFGHELFVRTPRGMQPTRRAQAVAVHVRKALAHVERAFEPQEVFNPKTSTRTFKLVTVVQTELTLLPLLLTILDAGGEQISVELHNDNDPANVERVARAEMDMHFSYHPAEGQSLNCVKVTNIELAVIASATHPRIRRRLTKARFLAERHVVYMSYPHQLTGLELLVTGKRLKRRAMATVTQISSVPALVEHTDAIATMPRPVAEYFAATHKLSIFRFPLERRKLDGYIIWHKALDADPAHRWLRDTIAQLLPAVKR